MSELNEIIELSEKMFNLALGGEWEQLVDLEKVRREKLVNYFDPEQLDSLPVEAMEVLQQIMEQDQKIERLCDGARSEIANHLSSAKQGKQMVQAYGLV